MPTPSNAKELYELVARRMAEEAGYVWDVPDDHNCTGGEECEVLLCSHDSFHKLEKKDWLELAKTALIALVPRPTVEEAVDVFAQMVVAYVAVEQMQDFLLTEEGNHYHL